MSGRETERRETVDWSMMGVSGAWLRSPTLFVEIYFWLLGYAGRICFHVMLGSEM